MTMDSILKTRLIAEVGDPNGTVSPLLDDSWDSTVYQGQNQTDLRYLLTKRTAISVRLAEEQESADITVGQDVVDAQGQIFIHMQSMYDENQAEIVRLLAVLSASGAGASGVLTRTRFQDPPMGSPDAGDPAYSGSPYVRWPRWPRW